MDIKELQQHGQSVWLDYFRRDLITSRALARMVSDDGIRGITTNPTIDALRDHGEAADHLEAGLDQAHDVMDALERAGVSIEELADTLVEEGVQRFAQAFDGLFATLAKKRARILSEALDRTS